ncbi:MAG: GDP-L-fucose synthase [Nanoarchaeota archaeon]
MNLDSKIMITGANGMVGRSLVKKLKKEGYNNLLTPSSKELDLKNQNDVEKYFKENKPNYVFHLAAKVGGIAANIESPADFLHDNLIMQSNVIEFARKYKVEKLLFLGSSCIYPKNSPQPMKEEYVLTGKLEPTNEGYGISKIAGLKMCQYYNKQHGTNFISLMPCNLYGPNDHFDPQKSHVVPALILKFHKAKKENLEFVEIWGTGNVKRELLFVEDLTDAITYFMLNYNAKDLDPFINIGYGEDVTIKQLAFMIKDVVGYNGEIRFNPEKPEGMSEKLVDLTKSKEFGWQKKVSLMEGLKNTYSWYLENAKN